MYFINHSPTVGEFWDGICMRERLPKAWLAIVSRKTYGKPLRRQAKVERDLVPLLGSKSLVSDFLNGRRDLSLNQIRRLVGELRIPA